jgi:CRP-like cAMP-binding protein
VAGILEFIDARQERVTFAGAIGVRCTLVHQDDAVTATTPSPQSGGETPNHTPPCRRRTMLEPDASQNWLLAVLPEPTWQRWKANLQPVDLPLGRVLHEAGAVQGHAWFPTTAIVSLIFVLADGGTSELAVVGNDGVVGTSSFMGGGSAPSRAVVCSAGRGFRVSARFIQDEFDWQSPVTHLLLLYTQALMTQMAQTTVCNRYHSLDQQLCRWLLLSLDRARGNELVMTQELIATMLGVRREGVTEAALKLQRAGIIRYTRGHITVLDRAGLERRSCECYAVVRNECDRLQRRSTPAPASLQARRQISSTTPASTTATEAHSNGVTVSPPRATPSAIAISGFTNE